MFTERVGLNDKKDRWWWLKISSLLGSEILKLVSKLVMCQHHIGHYGRLKLGKIALGHSCGHGQIQSINCNTAHCILINKH